MQIVLATHNRGKMAEMSAILADLSIELLTLDQFPEIGDIPETGETLRENAFIKAETVHRMTQLPSLADDTGLEVDALGGAPGVHSSRYAGEDVSFDDNCKKMLQEMNGIPQENRTARFRTVMAWVTDEDKYWTEGTVEGQILTEKRGTGGFGYDPLFYVPGLKKTFAEIPSDVKNKISHRGKALQNMRKLMETLINTVSG